MIYLLWSGHNQVIKSPFDAAGPDYNREALTAEQKEFHSRFDKNIKEAFKVKAETMTPAKEATFEQDARHFQLSISADKKGKKSRTPRPPRDISSSSTSAQSGGEQQELPKPDSDDMELDEEEEGELIFQSINQPLLANECAISRLERRIVMEAVFKDPETGVREDGNKKRARMMVWQLVVDSLQALNQCTLIAGIARGNLFALVTKVQRLLSITKPDHILRDLQLELVNFNIRSGEAFVDFHARYVRLVNSCFIEGHAITESTMLVQIKAAIKPIEHLQRAMLEAILIARVSNSKVTSDELMGILLEANDEHVSETLRKNRDHPVKLVNTKALATSTSTGSTNFDPAACQYCGVPNHQREACYKLKEDEAQARKDQNLSADAGGRGNPTGGKGSGRGRGKGGKGRGRGGKAN